MNAATLTEAIVLSGARAALSAVHPWVVTVDFELGERRDRVIKVEQRTYADPPDPWDMAPQGAVYLRADVFPAERFCDMPQRVRERYRLQYRAYLMWRKSWALQKPVHALVAGVDFEPALVDENVERWIAAGMQSRDVA